MLDTEQLDLALLDLEARRQSEGHHQDLDAGLNQHGLGLVAFTQLDVVEAFGHELVLQLPDEALEMDHFFDGQRVQTGYNN